MEDFQTIHWSHYNSKQQILLVGEGDFSFSLCLARAFRSATNITATSLDTREELVRKYKNAKSNVEELERLGCTVVHGFHFGRERDDSIIMQHQKLVRGFLRSAGRMVKYDGGEIHITHKTAYPFASWNLKSLGSEVCLDCYREMEFFDTLVVQQTSLQNLLRHYLCFTITEKTCKTNSPINY